MKEANSYDNRFISFITSKFRIRTTNTIAKIIEK
jgi:hypothetical protein